MKPVVALTDLGARGCDAVAFAHRWAGPRGRLLVALQRPPFDPIAPLLPHRAHLDPAADAARARSALVAHVEEVTGRGHDEYEIGEIDPGPIAAEAARFASLVDAEVLVTSWPLDLVDARGQWLLDAAPCPVLIAGKPGPGPVVAVLRDATDASSIVATAMEASRRMARPYRSIVARGDGASLEPLSAREVIGRRIQALLTASAIRDQPHVPTGGEEPTRVPLDAASAMEEVDTQLDPGMLVCGAPGPGEAETLQRTLEQLTAPLLVTASPPSAGAG